MKFSSFEGLPNPDAAHQGPLTVAGTAVSLADLGVTIHKNTKFVLVTVETASLRLTVNGTTPTSTLGFLKDTSCEILLSEEEAVNAKLIRSTATSATIQVAQFSA